MRGMDCRKIEQLISPFIDGELTLAEAEILRAHLSSCANCAKEYEAMAQLSAACKEWGDILIPAPAGFKDDLMLLLNKEIAHQESITARVGSGHWLSRNWKQATAGVAAAILLVIGTLSMSSSPVVQLAQNPPSITQPENPSPTIGNNNGAGDTNNTGSNSQTNTVTNPSGTQTPITGGNTIGSAITPNSTAVQKESPMVFLSKDRYITSVLLQVKVGDSYTASQKVLSMSDKAGAQTQNLGQQVNDNGTYTLLKITVPKSTASDLIAKLGSLGTVAGKDVNNSDISSEFADKYSQYQTLTAQRTALQDATQKTNASLDQRIKTLENELQDWDQQANEETIVLWLEK